MKNIISILIAFCLLSLTSCQKNSHSEIIDEGSTVVRINIPQIDEQEVLDLQANSSGKSMSEDQLVDLEGGDFVIASLDPVNKSNSLNLNKIASTEPVRLRTTLGTGVRYSVYVYSTSGAYIAHRDYVVGKENETEVLKISGGRAFTFVAYSINSKESLPIVQGAETLSTAKLDNISEDLMYYKETVDIVASSENVLNIVLKHQFSSIETVVKLTDANGNDLNSTDARNIYNVNDLIFSNLSNSASLTFSDDKLSFVPISVNNTKIAEFDKTSDAYKGLRKEKTTNSTILVSPQNTDVSVNIPAITIYEGAYEHTKGNITIPNIRVTPGRKYKLILKVFKVATSLATITNETGTPALNNHLFSKSGTNNTFYKYNSAADLSYGLTVDIHEIDNSFNLVINDRPIAILASVTGPVTYDTQSAPSYEIEFQSTWRSGKFSSNIMFKDYNMYEHYVINNKRYAGYASEGVTNTNSLKSVWNVIGNYNFPTIRIVISPSGKIDIFGAKSSLEPLQPMVFRTDTDIPTSYQKIKFQDVLWNKDKANTIAITQIADGATVIKGSVRGFKSKP